MAARNPRWYTRRVREDVAPATFQQIEQAEQQIGRPMSDEERRQWIQAQPSLDAGWVEWHGATPEDVGELYPGERKHTADGWWMRSGEGKDAGKYYFKSEAPTGSFIRTPAENPRGRRADPTAWRNTPAGDAKYREARAEAQRKANEMGMDVGIEANDLFKEWHVFLLPRAENRSGHELRAEVVHPEDLSRVQPGHGPMVRENPLQEHVEPGVKTIFVFREQEPYSSSGFAYRAYRADKTPLYIGAESMRELEVKLKDRLLGRDPDFMPSYRIVRRNIWRADFE
jgi:hypothetical protein